MDMSRGYEIQAAPEGGFCVIAQSKAWGEVRATIAAFSTASDLIVWLAGKYDIKVHAVAAGGTHISIDSLNLRDDVKKMAAAAVQTAIRESDSRSR